MKNIEKIADKYAKEAIAFGRFSHIKQAIIDAINEVTSEQLQVLNVEKISFNSTEKDYEILQCRTNCIGHKEKEILKVKRLPDGNVFTLGDNYRGYIIKGFQELDNILWVHFHNVSYPISTIHKFPKPILTTKNGVELFEGDKHHWVHDDMRIGHDLTDASDPAEGYKYFSTRETAEIYRLNHAKMLCINDLEDDGQLRKLRKLVKSRLK